MEIMNSTIIPIMNSMLIPVLIMLVISIAIAIFIGVSMVKSSKKADEKLRKELEEAYKRAKIYK